MDFLPGCARYHRMHMLFPPCPASAQRRLQLQRLASMAARIGLCGLLAGAVPAYAQLGGPRLNLPTLPSLQRLPVEPRLPVPQAVNPVLSTIPLQQLRLTTVRNLLRQHPDLLEADPSGEPIRRAELVLLSPAPGLVDAALALGFTLLRMQALPELDLHQMVLRPPSGQTTAQALTVLRALRPDVEADFNHIYTASGEVGTDGSPAHTSAAARVRVGLIDGGVDARHPALGHSELHLWGCQGAPVPSVHGTAVASLLVGTQGTQSPAPDAVLYAADIYCGLPTGGAAEDVASALAWMARERVAVVNISLVGPANRVLERSVQALTRKGHVVVAAVGNDGPAAPPLYPASYAGAVGVTGVTRAQKVLPEAAQGPQVMFAAPGAQISVAQMGGGYHTVRGTSFAAPRVAALLAQQIQQPDVAVAQAALARLAAAALDLGAPGRDPVFGLGLVGAETP